MRNSSSERLSGMARAPVTLRACGASPRLQRLPPADRVRTSTAKPQQPLQQLGALARGAWITEGLAQGPESAIQSAASPTAQDRERHLAAISGRTGRNRSQASRRKHVVDTAGHGALGSRFRTASMASAARPYQFRSSRRPSRAMRRIVADGLLRLERLRRHADRRDLRPTSSPTSSPPGSRLARPVAMRRVCHRRHRRRPARRSRSSPERWPWHSGDQRQIGWHEMMRRRAQDDVEEGLLFQGIEIRRWLEQRPRSTGCESRGGCGLSGHQAGSLSGSVILEAYSLAPERYDRL